MSLVNFSFTYFFGEYHCKCLCDDRFSKISGFLKEYSETRWIRTLNDVVNCVQTMQHEKNQSRIHRNKAPIISYQFILELTERPNRYYNMNLPRDIAMKNFYCYVFASNAWRAYLNSTLPHSDLSFENNQYFQQAYSETEGFVNATEYHHDAMIPLKLGLFNF